jgi:hypothetical protein
MALLLCTILIVGIMPAYAAGTTSPYDFSAVDALDKYDSYTKKVADGTSNNSSLLVGTEYVGAAMYNDVDTSRPRPAGDFRYSAFLRDANEKQNYVFFNLKNLRYDKNMPANVLTIYADPEVEFTVCNASGKKIADKSGPALGNVVIGYFNKSVDNGHNVFYFELNPMENSESCTSITFEAPQTTDPAHYSFWFGTPLLVSGTTSSKLMLYTSKPNTTSSKYTVLFPFSGAMAKRTWIDSISVQKTYFSGKDNCSAIKLSLLYPGKKYAESEDILSTGNTTYTANLNSINSYLADGDYVFQLTDISWRYNAYGRDVDYKANVTLNYFQPFGY